MSKLNYNMDNPYVIPANNVAGDLDLSLAVQSYKPGKYDLDDLPDISPVYRHVKGRLPQKQGNRRARVVSMPTGGNQVKDLPPIPKSRVISDGCKNMYSQLNAIHGKNDANNRRTIHSYSPESHTGLTKSILKNPRRKSFTPGSTPAPGNNERAAGSTFAAFKNRLNRYVPMENPISITRNTTSTGPIRQGSISKVNKPTRTRSKEVRQGPKQSRFKRLSLFMKPDSQGENYAVKEERYVPKSVTFDLHLDTTMESENASASKLEVPVLKTEESAITDTCDFLDDSSSIYSCLDEPEGDISLKNDQEVESSYVYCSSTETPKEEEPTRSPISSEQPPEEYISNSSRQNYNNDASLSVKQVDTNSQEEPEYDDNSVRYMSINLLREYFQESSVKLLNGSIAEDKDSSTFHGEPQIVSDLATAEKEEESKSPEFERQLEEEDNVLESVSSLVISDSDSADTRKYIVDDDDLDSLFSKHFGNTNVSESSGDSTKLPSFHTLKATTHNTLDPANYAYDQSIHDSIFSYPEQEEQLNQDTNEETSSTISMKKVRGKKTHTSQPSESHSYGSCSSGTNSSLSDSISSMKKYVQQRPFSFCLGDNKDYETTRYMIPQALKSPNCNGSPHILQPSENRNSSRNQGKRYFTTTGKIERNTATVDDLKNLLASKNLVDLESILGEAMTAKRVSTAPQLPAKEPGYSVRLSQSKIDQAPADLPYPPTHHFASKPLPNINNEMPHLPISNARSISHRSTFNQGVEEKKLPPMYKDKPSKRSVSMGYLSYYNDNKVDKTNKQRTTSASGNMVENKPVPFTTIQKYMRQLQQQLPKQNENLQAVPRLFLHSSQAPLPAKPIVNDIEIEKGFEPFPST